MTSKYLQFSQVSFTYESMTNSLISDFSFSFSQGWHGVAGANGTGKTTLLKLASGILEPDSGAIIRPGIAWYCSQRTDQAPANFREMLEDYSPHAAILMDTMEISPDFADRWNTLSHGERKRSQIACALWEEPDILAIDEPTNHLDRRAREILLSGLSKFHGVGLIVSHDRELLDRLCADCAVFYGGEIRMKPGGVTAAMSSVSAENTAAQKLFEQKQKKHIRLEEELARRKHRSLNDNFRGSKRGLDLHDSDGRSRIDAARLGNKDVTGGNLQKQMEQRVARSNEELNGLKFVKEKKTGIVLRAGASSRNYLFMTAGEEIKMGEAMMELPGLVIKPDDKIAVCGANGTGKTTLINHIYRSLNLSAESVCYIPQEIDEEAGASMLRECKKYGSKELGMLMTIISRLGSDPERLLESVSPSPGETRKLFLARGILRSVEMIIMDEPTNHMDLPSILCLEKALSECPAALLLVSHDRVFLEKITGIGWETQKTEKGSRLVVV